MKLGVFIVLFGDKKLPEALDKALEYGLDMVEVGCGNYPGNAHCKPAELLKDIKKRDNFMKEFDKRGLGISALSCHANSLHPDRGFARRHHETQRQTIQLASALGVPCVNTFSGCPGGGPRDRTPNWITCSWPPDYMNSLKWQWEKVVIPYWKEEAKFAKRLNVKICFEMHPGFVVYNPETLLKVRAACGESIGANFDPSHLFWQGIDPIAAVRELKGAIYHVHAKDTAIDPYNTAANGVLDTKHYGELPRRSWIFRTCGYGNGAEFWRGFVSALRVAGYDYVLSIEHEDALMSQEEGLSKGVEFLRSALLHDPMGKMWWA